MLTLTVTAVLVVVFQPSTRVAVRTHMPMGSVSGEGTATSGECRMKRISSTMSLNSGSNLNASRNLS